MAELFILSPKKSNPFVASNYLSHVPTLKVTTSLFWPAAAILDAIWRYITFAKTV